MMTDDEIIEVVSAHKEGKKIQGKCKRLSNIWVDLTTTDGIINWDFVDKEYRVAPGPRKPREWILHIPDEVLGKEGQARIYPATSSGHTSGWVSRAQCVRVREILE